MGLIESLTNFVEKISPAQGVQLRTEDKTAEQKFEDLKLSNSISIILSGIDEQSKNTDFRPEMREKLVTILFQTMLEAVRNHPSFGAVELLQVNETHGISQKGELIELTDVNRNETLFTMDQIKQFLPKSPK